jgi:AcrR family transcriptional regulator
MIPPGVLRARNAMATRQAILDCARERLREEGYDGASLREIAACAGVDAALISRYFGSKEELLVAVLQSGRAPVELFCDPRETFGRRMADFLVCTPPDDRGLDCLVIVLRSLSSQVAAEAIRKTSHANFYAPLVDWLGGPDAQVKGQLIAAIMKGVAISRFMDSGLGFDDEARMRFRDRLATTLQRIVDDP